MLTEHGVQIAPRTFYAWARRAPSKRSLWDAAITEVLAGFYESDEHGRRQPESLYGSVKMWAHLQRQGFPVAKSTVERLMRRNGWQGVRRRKSVRTTIADPAAERAPDLVDRQFRVSTPNALLVADFTYVKLVTGVFVYVAFVIDAYAGAIIGWEAAKGEADPVRGVRDPPSRCATCPARPPDRRCHPPLGCRKSVHCSTFRRDAIAVRAAAVDRKCRGCL